MELTNKPVIPISNPDGTPLPYRVFDPCIWNKDGVYYSLSGGTLPHEPSGKRTRANFLFKSKDLINWEYLHPFIEGDRFTLIGDDGACPYFWPIGDRHILLFFSHMSGGQALLGDYDSSRDKFIVTSHQDFNFGAYGPSGVHATSETPDGRSGIAVLLFAMDSKGLAKQVLRRVGQCILTSPTTACFSGLDSDEKINLGNAIRFFGDGFQVSKKINDKKIWRIPVMEGEFVIEDKTSITKGIGGGNILIIGDSNQEVLKSAEAAVKEMRKVNNIILPFPGGIVRSGSKVGSKYKSLIASTNDAYCPTLKGITKTKLSKSNESVLEIVIDGINEKDISLAMKKGINIICKKFNKGNKSISAGNYGGKLGPHHFHLRDVMK